MPHSCHFLFLFSIELSWGFFFVSQMGAPCRWGPRYVPVVPKAVIRPCTYNNNNNNNNYIF